MVKNIRWKRGWFLIVSEPERFADGDKHLKSELKFIRENELRSIKQHPDESLRQGRKRA